MNTVCVVYTLLLIYIQTTEQAGDEQGGRFTSGSFVISTDPLSWNGTVSSEVINQTNVVSKFDCLSNCHSKDCLLAIFFETDQICQLVTLNDVSNLLGISSGYKSRSFAASAPGAKVWKANDYDDQLRKRRHNSSYFLSAFRSVTTGRNGIIQRSVVNTTGCYRIEIAGAKGGDNSFASKVGGRGAYAFGSFSLTSGTQLSIVVGQVGRPVASLNAAAGGGGGSFVYRTVDTYLLMAAGGAGGATFNTNGMPGQAGANGTVSDPCCGIGGVNGGPGYNNPNSTLADRNHGGCGAGWLGKAVNPRRRSTDGDRGGGLADGWFGGVAGNTNTGEGGFGGGGGGGAAATWGAAGAGGGFSGGGAGTYGSHAGGGGGSYCSGSGCNATTGGNSGTDGFVILRLLAPFASTCD